MEGFGANINPVNHWKAGRLTPVLDLLTDDLGATVFRLDPYGFTNWVDPGSTADRSILHAETYARVYRSQPFQEAWAMARYLNSKGARLILNVSGVVPRWMCAEDDQTLVDLEAYADLLTSLALWARNEEGIKFHLFGPFNETDIGPPEGPFANPTVAARVLKLLVDRFKRAGLHDIKFVVVDQARYNLDYLRAILTSECLHENVSVAGMHCYGDFPLKPVRDFIAQNGLHHWSYWLTEYGDLDQSGEKEWEVAAASTRRLLRGMIDGVQAAMVWDAYDNFHGHDDGWSLYGLLRTGSKGYTPKKRYYAAKQIYRFVPPGAARIKVSSDDSNLLTAAFQTPQGDLTLVGLNEGEPLRLDVTVGLGTAAGKLLHLFLTSHTENCSLAYEFPLGEKVRLTIPGESIFTLTTLDR